MIRELAPEAAQQLLDSALPCLQPPEYCWQAREKAKARSAYHEAVGYCEQAFRPLQHLSETRTTHGQAIDLRLALCSALLPSHDSGHILICLREALAMAIDNHRRLGQISGYLCVHFRNMGAYDQAIAAAQRALTLSTAVGDAVVHTLANFYLGVAHWAQGDCQRAIDCLRQTAACLRRATDR